MITATLRDSEEQLIARDTERDHGPFSCPECRSEVILKKGRVKTHHFAHKPPVDCAYGQGETELHRRAKLEIFDLLSESPLCRSVGLEAAISRSGIRPVRPDVRAYIRDRPVAIEVQVSLLTEREIRSRTVAYWRLGTCVLWLPVALPYEDQSGRYSPKVWERFVHNLYYGRVHYWDGGLKVTPVHFGEYLLHVEQREWYTQNGDHQMAGGYLKKSKRYRTLIDGETTSILDFKRVTRPAAMGAPAALLWQSREPPWW